MRTHAGMARVPPGKLAMECFMVGLSDRVFRCHVHITITRERVVCRGAVDGLRPGRRIPGSERTQSL